MQVITRATTRCAMPPIILPDTIHSLAKGIEIENTEDRAGYGTAPSVQSEIPELEFPSWLSGNEPD